jgi:hypothetical protein
MRWASGREDSGWVSSHGESHPEALAETFTRLDSTLVLPDGQSKPYFPRALLRFVFLAATATIFAAAGKR